MKTRQVREAIASCFQAAACDGALHVASIGSGATSEGKPAFRFDADKPEVMASVFKVIVALEVYDQIAKRALDPARMLRIDPAAATPGPTGLSVFAHPAEVGVEDLASLMLQVSDNTATDALIALVSIERVRERARENGLQDTHILSDLKSLFDAFARELGFVSYTELLAAQRGHRGEDARARSRDRAAIDACAILDPRRATRSTPADMTTFLVRVWTDQAAHPQACAMLRAALEGQVARRLEGAVPDGGTLAAKSGSFLGRVRNEVAVITYPDGARYACAVFTRAHAPFVGAGAINAAMAQGVRLAIEALR